MRNRKMTREQHVKMLYGRDPSFISNLPYAEYLEEEGVMLLMMLKVQVRYLILSL